MTDIFLSRPNWMPSVYQEGFNNFLRLLENLELIPHTIGATDYPIESPLDEVIEQMDKTKGVLILGYPQIFISQGKLKDQMISSHVHLATEWNHIEASLAYAKKLPMLIIHDIGIQRGIFDRGAINKFVYEKDLKDKSWALSKEINGAIKNWKNKIENYSNGEEYYHNYPLRLPLEVNTSLDILSDEAKNLLSNASNDKHALILRTSSFDGLSISTNNKQINEVGNPRDESLWESALDELEKHDLIRASNYNRESFKVTNKGFDFADKLNRG